jgi:hypothetical protein
MAESRPHSNAKNRPLGGRAESRPVAQQTRKGQSSHGRASRHEAISLAIDSELGPNSHITKQEIEAICLLLGDDLDRLFSN